MDKILINNIDSPKDLLEWFNKNVTYESKKKGYLRLPEQVIKDKKAHCWEACELTHVILNHLGYLVETLYIDTRNCSVTHTAIIYTHNQKYYWFEWAWKKHEGIHEFKSFDDLIDYFRCCFMEEYGNYFTFVKTRSLIIHQDDTEESIVKKLSVLTISLDNQIKLMDYRVLRTSDINIRFYKKHNHNLSHVRTGDKLNGLLLVNKENNEFVAVLQTSSENNYIQALEVSPKYRGLGIAKKLLSKAVSKFNANKLSVNKNNHVAINLYKTNGWIIEDENSSMLFMKYRDGNLSLETFIDNKPSYLRW